MFYLFFFMSPKIIDTQIIRASLSLNAEQYFSFQQPLSKQGCGGCCQCCTSHLCIVAAGLGTAYPFESIISVKPFNLKQCLMGRGRRDT